MCYDTKQVVFDKTKQTEENWRITANPLAWGNQQAEVIVLGFSKGPTQSGALENTPHDKIAYKGNRLNVGKILAHVGLLEKTDSVALKNSVDKAIADKNSRFHFGSLIRCTVEQYDSKKEKWKGSGGGMLDKFVAIPFSQQCTSRFLGNLPTETKLVIMFGLGSKQNYVRESYRLFQMARPSSEWKLINEVSYTDGKITVVHVEHFASQGVLIPSWLGENKHDRSRLGDMAKSSVESAMQFRN